MSVNGANGGEVCVCGNNLVLMGHVEHLELTLEVFCHGGVDECLGSQSLSSSSSCEMNSLIEASCSSEWFSMQLMISSSAVWSSVSFAFGSEGDSLFCLVSSCSPSTHFHFILSVWMSLGS